MGWMELLVVGAVALIVVGPKDLPVMFQALGRITAKVKRMAREFQTAMSDAAKASGTSDISRDLRGLTSPKTLGLDSLKNAADSFERWDPMASKHSEPGSAKGPETAKLTAERAEQARRIREQTAKTAQDRLDREAAEDAEVGTEAAAGTDGESTVAPSDPAVSNGKAPEPSSIQPAKPETSTAATGKPAAAASRKPRKRKDGNAEPATKGELKVGQGSDTGPKPTDSDDESRA